MKEYIHKKRDRKKGNKHSSHSYNNIRNGSLPAGFEVVFKWVPIEAVRISSAANQALYEEYKQERGRMLKETVFNPDGTENKEGVARLRQAGLSDRDIYESIGKGKTPNGYNYHHLFPRALSGALNEGSVQFGNETLTSLHDWRCMMPLPNSAGSDIHKNVHDAMEKRNGPMPEKEGSRTTYYIAMPLTAEEYQQYKRNPESLKEELLIVGKNSYRTVDQRDNGKGQKQPKPLKSADIAKIKAARDGR
ncbi:MAG: hypothetical protein J5716_04810 [Alphaproteobacteria bacterium]|nr:hypothetical protein [Alphaproteobacteria bacterium]